MDIKTVLKSSVAAGALLALAVPVGNVADAAGLSASNGGKVDVKVGGRVGRSVMHVDDGVHDGLFHLDGRSTDSEWWITGSGKLTENVTMSGVFDMNATQAGDSPSFGTTSGTGDATTAAAAQSVDNQYVRFKHSSMGTITIGHTSEAGDGANNLAYGNSVHGAIGGSTSGFNFTTGAAGAFSADTSGSFVSNLDPGDSEEIRYDSPAINGFTLAASTHQDSSSAVALRYTGKLGGMDMKAAAHYLFNDGKDTMGGSAAFKHASGFHFAAGYGKYSWDSDAGAGRSTNTIRLTAGYTMKANSLGATDLTVHYAETEDLGAYGDSGEWFEVGIDQTLDAVGGSIGIAYSRVEASDSANTDYNDLDAVVMETVFNF